MSVHRTRRPHFSVLCDICVLTVAKMVDCADKILFRHITTDPNHVQHQLLVELSIAMHNMNVYSVSQKTIHLTFDDYFGKCRPIYKILTLSDSPSNSLCNCYRVFHLTLTVLLHYLVKFTNLK